MTQQIQATTNTDALKKIRMAARVLYAIGFLCFFIGGIAFAFANQAEGGAIIASLMVIFGGVYTFLGYMINKKSKAALVTASVLMVLCIISGILTALQTGSPFGLVLPIGVLTQLGPAFSALEELKQG